MTGWMKLLGHDQPKHGYPSCDWEVEILPFGLAQGRRFAQNDGLSVLRGVQYQSRLAERP